MATITMVSARVSGDVYKYTWETMGDADTGTPLNSPGLADKTVTVTGTFGSAAVVIQGSNDGTNWYTLTGADSTEDLSFTAAGIAIITENPLQIRPSTSGGTGTDVDVIIVAKRA